MHQGRLRLRPWLEEQIKSGRYPGVIWLDETAKVFQIPWKHAARHGWNIDKDATLFRNWAIHTGRYKPGVDKPDPKTWKANFRCALNSLPDVQELRDKSIKKGHNAYRVYILLPNSKAPKRRKVFRSLDPDATRVHLPALLPHTNAPLQRFTEAFWKYKDSTGLAPEVHTKNSFTALSSVKEEWSPNETQANAMEDHEQTEAVLKIVDHLQNTEHWSPLYEHERSWRPTSSWMECLYETADCSSYHLQTDSYNHGITSQFV